MHFCPKCGNMYYLQLKKDDEDQLIYYCRNCGNEDESLVTNLNNLYVSKTDIKKEVNYKNSIKDYKKALKLNPEDGSIHIGIGNAKYQLKLNYCKEYKKACDKGYCEAFYKFCNK